jgi:hypothetical protein
VKKDNKAKEALDKVANIFGIKAERTAKDQVMLTFPKGLFSAKLRKEILKGAKKDNLTVTFNPTVPIQTDIYNCSRCRGNHEKMSFEPLKGDPIDGVEGNYTHWAKCPVTEQPIVLRVEKKRETKPAKKG